MTSRILTSPELDTALDSARGATSHDLWNTLLQLCGSDASALGEALLLHHGVHVVDESAVASATVLDRMPDGGSAGPTAAWLRTGNHIYLLCRDPWEPAMQMALGRRPGSLPAIALPGQLESIRAAASTSVASAGATPKADATSRAGNEGPPVVAFVDSAIRRAYDDGASDIHFETDRRGIAVKYRIDGVMSPGEALGDPQRAEEVISRIKVMAQLDITERRRPQDGRIHWEAPGGNPLDLRVSVMPSIFGEDAVLRLLDKTQLRRDHESISLASLGFPLAMATRIRSLSSKPHGMLLVTGPTGSGKTTTVYAALSEVNDGLEKIITIEDPVEYELSGVLQIPVNEQKGLTFATGLRSILRHDPDRILVGEIRDAETAEIAVQSSLTGHLVMTTVHANSLFDVLGRFQHFGIDPFALASALNGVVVQRLLRRNCGHCAGWRAPTAGEAKLFADQGLEAPSRVPMPVGCEHCRGTGYRGRIVVAEVHELDDSHRDLVIRRASLLEMKEALYAGAAGLMAQALTEAASGHTSLEEIRRVVGTI
jgi:general secretion pathway protein E